MGGVSRNGWRLLLATIAGCRADLFRLGGWALLGALPALLSGQLVAAAIDRGFLQGDAVAGIAWLAMFLLINVVAALATRRTFPALGSIAESVRDTFLSRSVVAILRRGRGDASGVAQLTQQVETVRDVTAGLLLNVQQFVFAVVGAAVGLLALDPLILLIAFSPVVAALALFGLLMRTLITRQRTVMLAEESVAAMAGLVLDGTRDVVACGAAGRVLADAGRDIEAAARAAISMGGASARRGFLTGVSVHLPVLLVLVAIPLLIRRGVSVGAILGAITYLTVSLEPALRMVTQTLGVSGLRLAVALRRLAEIDRPSRLPRPPAMDPAAGCAIRLFGLRFSYGPHAEPVLRGLDLTIARGTHLAIVGASGIGKSTLASLIAGVLSPTGGEIRLGGAVTLIPQEAYVFKGTLRENLCYLRPDADPDSLAHAVEEMGLTGVSSRIGGLDAELEPAVLSAGERQLVALGRAYLSPAETLVLDEATCHLDPRAEAKAEEALGRRPGTLIVIAHRISSARRADEVLLLDGDLARHGSHSTLLAQSPVYADLAGHWDSELVHQEA